MKLSNRLERIMEQGQCVIVSECGVLFAACFDVREFKYIYKPALSLWVSTAVARSTNKNQVPQQTKEYTYYSISFKKKIIKQSIQIKFSSKMITGISTNVFRLRCRERRLVYCCYCYVYVFLCYVYYVSHCASWPSTAILTEVFSCFFLSCKANVRVKPAQMGHFPQFCKFLCCSKYCLFRVALCIVCV